jgi:hypothetical protein
VGDVTNVGFEIPVKLFPDPDLSNHVDTTAPFEGSAPPLFGSAASNHNEIVAMDLGENPPPPIEIGPLAIVSVFL